MRTIRVLALVVLQAAANCSARPPSQVPSQRTTADPVSSPIALAPSGSASVGAPTASATAPAVDCPVSGSVSYRPSAVRFGFVAPVSVTSLIQDSAGNFYVAGGFKERAQFPGIEMYSYGSQDAMIAKYDPNGALLWAQRFGDAGEDWIHALALHPSGDLIAVGIFRYRVPFGDTWLTTERVPNGFVARISPAGRIVWVRQIAGTESVRPQAVAVSPKGDIAVAGEFDGTIGSSPASRLASVAGMHPSEWDGFVSVYSDQGQVRWVRHFGNARGGVVRAIAYDPRDAWTVAGEVRIKPKGDRYFQDWMAIERYTNDGRDHLMTFDRLGAWGAQHDAEGNLYFDGSGQRHGPSPFKPAAVTKIAHDDLAPKIAPAWEAVVAEEGSGRAIEVTADGRALFGGSRSYSEDSAHPWVRTGKGFLSLVTQTGAPGWSIELEGAGEHRVTAITGSNQGRLMIAGTFEKEVGVLGVRLTKEDRDDASFVMAFCP